MKVTDVHVCYVINDNKDFLDLTIKCKTTEEIL